GRLRYRSPAAKPSVELLEGRQLLSGASPSFVKGDMLIGVADGIQWRHADGSLVKTLPTSALYNTGMAFDSNGNLYSTAFASNQVNRFDTSGVSLGTFGSGFTNDPTSIAFDASGNAYVGQSDGNHQVLKFDPTGNLLGSYNVQVEDRGSDWIELAA